MRYSRNDDVVELQSASRNFQEISRREDNEMRDLKKCVSNSFSQNSTMCPNKNVELQPQNVWATMFVPPPNEEINVLCQQVEHLRTVLSNCYTSEIQIERANIFYATELVNKKWTHTECYKGPRVIYYAKCFRPGHFATSGQLSRHSFYIPLLPGVRSWMGSARTQKSRCAEEDENLVCSLMEEMWMLFWTPILKFLF